MEGEGDSSPYTQAVSLEKSLPVRSTVNSVRVSTPVGVKCQRRLSAPTFLKFFFREDIHATDKLYTVAWSRSRNFNTLQRWTWWIRRCVYNPTEAEGGTVENEMSEKPKAMARQRNRNTLDNGMDELTSAFLIHCHPRQHRVFLSNNLWFILYRTWVRCKWHFESQQGCICMAFCDAIPLSANTGLRTLCRTLNAKIICYLLVMLRLSNQRLKSWSFLKIELNRNRYFGWYLYLILTHGYIGEDNALQ